MHSRYIPYYLLNLLTCRHPPNLTAGRSQIGASLSFHLIFSLLGGGYC
jgi:hypothetical protein